MTSSPLPGSAEVHLLAGQVLERAVPLAGDDGDPLRGDLREAVDALVDAIVALDARHVLEHVRVDDAEVHAPHVEHVVDRLHVVQADDRHDAHAVRLVEALGHVGGQASVVVLVVEDDADRVVVDLTGLGARRQLVGGGASGQRGDDADRQQRGDDRLSRTRPAADGAGRRRRLEVRAHGTGESVTRGSTDELNAAPGARRRSRDGPGRRLGVPRRPVAPLVRAGRRETPVASGGATVSASPRHGDPAPTSAARRTGGIVSRRRSVVERRRALSG